MLGEISASPRISLFRARIRSRSFDDDTLRVLDSILVSNDVNLLIGIRSALTEFMRDEAMLVFREIMEESVEIKLLCADFLITVFAIIGDVESCMALRYEALIMREENMVAFPGLKVSCDEWATFAEHSLEHGFPDIANQAYAKAILESSKAKNGVNTKMDDKFNDKRIQELNTTLQPKRNSGSVQAQAAAYLKRKNAVKWPCQPPSNTSAQDLGSSQFRNGLRKYNMRRFKEYRLQINTD